MKARIVAALGGNALLSGGDAAAQLGLVEEVADSLAHIIQEGYQVVITHGNGPQVGLLLSQQEPSPVHLPLDVCGAMSQGWLGYLLQQSLHQRLRQPVATLVTRVLVDEKDPSFQKPEKQIGFLLNQRQAEKLASQGKPVVKLKNGWRRVVPSPEPLEILEIQAIKTLIQARVTTITCGGGGVPVIYRNHRFQGVRAVIDKDLTSQLLANSIQASILLILTDVEKVSLNYGKPSQQELDTLTPQEAQRYLEEGHFAPGTMEPKIKAAIKFLENGGEQAIITSLHKTRQALQGKAGTRIAQ